MTRLTIHDQSESQFDTTLECRPKLSRSYWRTYRPWRWLMVAGAAASGVVLLVSVIYLTRLQYHMDATAQKVVGRPSVRLADIKQTDTGFSYAAAEKTAKLAHQVVAATNQANSTGDHAYTATLPTDYRDGMKFGTAEGDLSFKLVPLFTAAPGKLVDGHVVYPSTRSKQAYSFMRNGVKEDILLTAAPGDQTSYQWRLELGDLLRAELRPDGSIGLFSADQNLYGNVSIGDDKSRDLVEKAKKSGTKNHLAFVIPAPKIIQADGRTFGDSISFSLQNNVLTMTATKLKAYRYPISLDPTVVVTTTQDFRMGNDQGMLDYSTSGQIGRAQISSGSLAANFASAGTSFANSRLGQASAIYNGYIYVIGGWDGSTYRNDVIYAQITGAGTTGSWASAGTGFTNGRYFLAAAAYAGRLYITGGKDGSGTKYNDVQYVSLSSTGTITGSWQTDSTGLYSNPRWGLATAFANNYMYISGGYNDTTYYNDVWSAQVNPDGSLSTFSSVATFTTGRYLHNMVIYNDIMYILAGASAGGYLNDIYESNIRPDGTVSTFYAEDDLFTTARYGATAYAYRGFIYIIGGQQTSSTTGCKPAGSAASLFCSDVQYAPIKADGGLTFWATDTKYIGAAGSGMDRVHASGVAYDGYLYIFGGYNGFTDVRSAQINAATTAWGDNSVWTYSSNSFTTARYGHGAAVYNGYIYVMGGYNDASGIVSSTYYSQINPATGDLGVWNSTTGMTFGARTGFGLHAYNGFLYAFGGEDSVGTDKNDSHYIQINSNGTLAASWSTGTNLNTGRWVFGSAVYGGYLYAAGGESGGSALNTVEYAQIQANGSIGSWTTYGTNMGSARRYVSATAHNGKLYVVGGTNGAGTTLNSLEYVTISGGAPSGTWTSTNYAAAGNGRASLGVIAYNGYLYVIGGSDSGGTVQANVRYAQLAANGTPGTFNDLTTGLSTERTAIEHGVVASDNYLFVVGGNSNTSNQNSTENAYVRVQAQMAAFENTLNTGVSSNTNMRVDSLVANGAATCGMQMYYRTASTGGTWSALTYIPFVSPGQTITITTSNVQYVWVDYVMNDSLCGTQSNITDITLNWSYTSAPSAPTLNLPANAATGVSTTPNFQMRTAQLNNGYLQYKIDVCSTSNCSTIVRTIDQTASQTGWTGQDANTGTAYVGNSNISSSTMASHTYQTAALSTNTQYWWRAYAIDPANSNTFSAASSIWSFTTVNVNTTPTVPTLSAPGNGSTGVSTSPTFQISSTDADSDYIVYKIDICTTSNCSSILRTVDQSASQTGWTGQNANSGNAYSSGSTGSYGYQAPVLSNSTQYWWRAYAKDPAGTNVFSSASAIQSFTTTSGVPPSVNTDLRGGTQVMGGTKLAN